MVKVLWVAGIGGLAVFAGHIFFDLGSPSDPIFEALDVALFIVPAALLLIRGVRVRAERAAWWTMAAGMLLWALGYVYYYLELQHLAVPPYPSLAELLRATYCVAAVVGVLLLLKARAGEKFRVEFWLDAFIGALTLAAIATAFLIDLIIHTTGASGGTVATNIVHPMSDILILGMLLGVFTLTGWRPGLGWLGVGLVIAKAIVEAHGGSISVDSKPGVGSTFRVELPLPAPVTEPV